VSDCLICMEGMGSSNMFVLGCGHALCKSCAVHYVRVAIGEARSQVFPEGIRCPMHSSGCNAFLTAADASRLLTPRGIKQLEKGEEPPLRADARHGLELQQLTRHLPPGLRTWSDRQIRVVLSATSRLLEQGRIAEGTLSVDEVKRLNRFVVEAAIPKNQKQWCPNCRLLVISPEHVGQARRFSWSQPLRSAGRLLRWQPPTDVTCPHCSHTWDLRAAAGDTSYDERASAALIKLTSKPCPNRSCRQRISHFHGHGCHHISPNTGGCQACHQHFCFVCLRPHGAPGSGYQRNTFCRHGSSFCSNQNIAANLVMEPIPHDRRCGCVMCPHCKPGRPCEQCDGRCAVCAGIVPPGPSQLPTATVQRLQAPAWSALLFHP